MSLHRIAARYAKSLLDLATEQGQLEPVNEDIMTFRSVLSSRDFQLMLKSPIVQADKKSAILNALFKDRITPLTMQFFQICIRKGREGYLGDISQAFIDQYQQLKNITSVRLTTAVPADDAIKGQLAEQIKSAGLCDGEIRWESRVDPALIGGFIIELNDKRYDASVLHHLDTLRKNIRQKATL